MTQRPHVYSIIYKLSSYEGKLTRKKGDRPIMTVPYHSYYTSISSGKLTIL